MGDESRGAKRPKMMSDADSFDPTPVHSFNWTDKNVFYSIQNGSISAEKLFDRPNTFAILDHNPLTPGHTLVITKHHVSNFVDGLPGDAFGSTLQDVQVMVQAVQKATGCLGVSVRQNSGPAAGQTVRQLHFHVIPTNAPLKNEGCGRLPDNVTSPLVAKIRNMLPEEYSGEGFHAWIPSVEAMEELGMLLQSVCIPGTAILLNGQLGSGKTSISRGVVRAHCKDPDMFVPSPTFLLNLSYEEDTSHEQKAAPMDGETAGSAISGRTVHHMDPYRLGTKSEKMAGLIDFASAFENDVCVIEWPTKMPKSVLDLPRRQTIEVSISGMGAQAVGRHVHVRVIGESSGPAKAMFAKWRQESTLPTPNVGWRKGNAGQGGRPLLFDALAAMSGPPENIIVLGIESSCDDTAAAVVRGDGTVLAHRIASQTGLHEQYGGVKPDVARDAHAAAITSTVDGCLAQAGIGPDQLTAVAVTMGPGLSLCLQVGVRHAMQLAATYRKPLVPVHHMEAHALMARMPGVNSQPLDFPALLLLVSGGHNMLVKCEGVGRHQILGTTIDDSVGEAFDKTARLLGISAIPGGPQLEALAGQATPEQTARYKNKLPMPLRNDKNSCNFSFSGIKSAVASLIESELARVEGDAVEMEKLKPGIAAVFQDLCVRFLCERTERALARCADDSVQLGQPMVRSLVVAGGVAANQAVRNALTASAAKLGIPCVCPPVKFCTDNGLMVAWTGFERLRLGLYRHPPTMAEVESAVEVLPRWPLGPVDVRGMDKKAEKHLKLMH